MIDAAMSAHPARAALRDRRVCGQLRFAAGRRWSSRVLAPARLKESPEETDAILVRESFVWMAPHNMTNPGGGVGKNLTIQMGRDVEQPSR
jgi:hypothetical protein